MREELEPVRTPEPQVESNDIGPSEYRPSNLDALREYEITLRFLSRGMIIRVGCKEIAFSTVPEGLEELNKYFDNTYDEQCKWRKILNQ